MPHSVRAILFSIGLAVAVTIVAYYGPPPTTVLMLPGFWLAVRTHVPDIHGGPFFLRAMVIASIVVYSGSIWLALQIGPCGLLGFQASRSGLGSVSSLRTRFHKNLVPLPLVSHHQVPALRVPSAIQEEPKWEGISSLSSVIIQFQHICNMALRTELAISYDEDMFPVSAACTYCGERMPKPVAGLRSRADIILWFAARFLEHKRLRHPTSHKSDNEAIGDQDSC
jgi:hypothetical protein